MSAAVFYHSSDRPLRWHFQTMRAKDFYYLPWEELLRNRTLFDRGRMLSHEGRRSVVSSATKKCFKTITPLCCIFRGLLLR